MSKVASDKELPPPGKARYEWALNLVKCKTVLDSGCGYGNGSFILAAEALSVVGVDWDHNAIANARKHHLANLAFIEGSAVDVYLPKVQIVVSFEVIEHIQNYLAYLRCINNQLIENGELLISTPNAAFTKGRSTHFHHHEFEFSEMKDLLERQTGFRVLESFGQRVARVSEKARNSPAILKAAYYALYPPTVRPFKEGMGVQIHHCQKY